MFSDNAIYAVNLFYDSDPKKYSEFVTGNQYIKNGGTNIFVEIDNMDGNKNLIIAAIEKHNSLN